MEKQLYYYLVEFYYLSEGRRLGFVSRYLYSSSGCADLVRLEFLARRECRDIERHLRACSLCSNPKVFYTYTQRFSPLDDIERLE
jgi:hypothetical protein